MKNYRLILEFVAAFFVFITLAGCGKNESFVENDTQSGAE